MIDNAAQFGPAAGPGDELLELAVRHLEGRLAPPQRDQLNALLAEDPANRDAFVAVCAHASLLSSSIGIEEEAENAGFGDLEISRFEDFETGDSGPGVGDYQFPNPKSTNPFTIHYPLPTPFVGSPVFSYIAATLILGVMLLSAWAYKITHDYGTSLAHNSSYTKNSRGLTAPGEPAQRPDPVFVARVTGMKDCRWSDPATETYAGAFVPLGRQYALASGLMEITYRSGVKVILEGPCSYEVESAAGGFLALGKLTARVEERSEVGGQRSEARGLAASAASMQPQAAKPQAPSPKPQDPRPKTAISKSPNLQISKFTVRTPTAVVTDLGTEFGISVDENGDTTSHVFQGTINVRVAEGPAASDPRGPAASAAGDAGQITLFAGQSARVEKDAQTGDARIATGRKVGAPPQFVRRIHQPPKYLDLLDIVAGGDGTGRRRERGIDPETGMQDTVFLPIYRTTDGRYHRNRFFPLIDGVFMPDSDFGPVQLDSAGHTCDFPKAAEPGTFASIWARAAEVPADKRNKWITPKEIGQYWIYAAPFGPEFMPEGRGLLAMSAGSGITFDLAAIRKAHVNRPLIRFRATAGKASPSLAEMLAFIDGRLVWKSGVISDRSGVQPVEVPIRSADRFLTLVSIEAGDGRGSDWTVFGDPVLECLDSARENQ